MKIYKLIAAVGASLVLLFATNVPAQAAYTPANTSACWDNGDPINPAKVCFTVYYQRAGDGTGIKFGTLSVTLKGTTFPTHWNSSGVDGQWLQCWNQDNVVKFDRDGSQTDVALDPGSRQWVADVDALTANYITCSYDGIAHLQGQPDPEFKIKLTLN